MTQHTQGPWHWVESEDYGYEVNDERDDIIIASNMTKANAHLIAAAPELLEALILAEAQIESFYTATMTNAKSRDDNKAIKKIALDNVRAAIAKAKGE